MKWIKASEETFKNEDWMFRHFRYVDGLKLDTDLFEVVEGGLRKINGTGFLPIDGIEVLDESEPQPMTQQEIQKEAEGYTVFQKGMSDKFAEWYFAIKEQTGQPPLAMQIFYWFSKSLAELEEKDKEIERRRNLLEDVVNVLDLSESAIEKHGPLGTEPAELVRMVLAKKDLTIKALKAGIKSINQ